jgi:hypothetical protein
MSDLVKLRTVDAGELAHTAADGIIDAFRRPEFRAGLAVALVTTAFLARGRMRPGPAIAIAMLAGNAAERLYGMAGDIHETAVAQREHLAVLSARAAAGAPGKV